MINIASELTFSSQVEEVFIELFKEDFFLTLVGGAVRDFLIDGTLSKDLDFELRHNKEMTGAQWKESILSLKSHLEAKFKYQIKLLPFSILRITLDDCSMELSSPRLETHSDGYNKGHSDFEVNLFSQIDYSKSFKRRDFTINAMGLEINKTQRIFIDPYQGYLSLQSKELHYCTEEFFKDPVRLLRLLRFSIRFGFKFSKKLNKELHRFNLEKLSNFYFFSESEKVGIVKFSKMFFSVTEAHNIPYPDRIKKIAFF